MLFRSYLASRHKAEIGRSPRVTCLLNAKAVEIQMDADGRRAEAVRLRSLEGREGLVRATTVVLCGGGIENPRLLLASWQGERRGISNGHDLVGRYRAEPGIMPPPWGTSVPARPQGAAQTELIGDFVAGMTGRFAIEEHRRLFDATPDLR